MRASSSVHSRTRDGTEKNGGFITPTGRRCCFARGCAWVQGHRDQAPAQNHRCRHRPQPAPYMPHLEDRKINIIGLMREAYADFSLYDVEGLDVSGYDVYHALEAESYTGDLVTNIFAIPPAVFPQNHGCCG